MLRLLTFVALLHTVSGCAAAQPRSPIHPDACVVVAEPSRPIALEDGRTVVVDASDMAARDGSTLIVGAPIYVWPRDPSDTLRINPPPSIGVVIDGSLPARLVPSPRVGFAALHPRVASAGRSSWHVLFVNGELGAPGNVLAYPEAELWYGRYDADGWHDVERVAKAEGASLLPRMSSELKTIGDQVVFAYAFDTHHARERVTPAVQGVVLLRRSRGKWVHDTLPTWEAPSSVQLTDAEPGVIRAVIAQGYFENGRVQAPSLFTVRYDGDWSEPRLVIPNARGYVVWPQVANGDWPDAVVTWRHATPSSPTHSIAWGRLSGDGMMEQFGSVGSIAQELQPVTLQATNDQALLAIPGSQHSGQLRLVVFRHATVAYDSTINAPMHSGAVLGTKVARDEFLFHTGGMHATPFGTHPTSFLTLASVRCPSTSEPDTPVGTAHPRE